MFGHNLKEKEISRGCWLQMCCPGPWASSEPGSQSATGRASEAQHTPALQYQMCQPALRKAGRGQSEKIQMSLEQEPALPAAQSWDSTHSHSTRALLSPSKHKAATKGIRQWGNQELSQDCRTSKGVLDFLSLHTNPCASVQLCLCAHTILGWQGHLCCLTEAAEAALGGKRCCPSPGSLRAALLPPPAVITAAAPGSNTEEQRLMPDNKPYSLEERGE